MVATFPNKVWTEREGDIAGTPQNEADWEACVTASYAMGLVHGGFTFPAPYSQMDRERLELRKDEPQDFATTDAMSLKVYGRKLRTLSTGSIADAVRRELVGLVLVGIGSPGRQWQPGFAGQHAVFYVPTSDASGYLGDPLAPSKQLFELITSAKIVAWAKGAGPNDAREVRLGEFAPPIPIDPKLYTQKEMDAATASAYNSGLAAAQAAVEALPDK